MFLHQRGVMAGTAKKIFAAAVAAEQAAAVNRPAGQLRFGAAEQLVHVLVGGGGVAALELDRLAHARQRADGQHAGIGVAAEQSCAQENRRDEILRGIR